MFDPLCGTMFLSCMLLLFICDSDSPNEFEIQNYHFRVLKSLILRYMVEIFQMEIQLVDSHIEELLLILSLRLLELNQLFLFIWILLMIFGDKKANEITKSLYLISIGTNVFLEKMMQFSVKSMRIF